MKSLFEVGKAFGRKYLWGMSDDESSSKVRRELIGNSVYTTKELVKGVDLELLRRIVESEPLLRKAIAKKNSDTFKNWFEVKTKDGENAPDDILELIHNFDKKTNFPSLLYKSGFCSNTYGTGFIEKLYREPNKTKSDTNATGKQLIDIALLNSECIRERKVKPNDKTKTNFLVYKKKGSSEELFIHPSRVEVVRIDHLPHSYFGISTVKVLWNILKSKMLADVSSGEILNWFGRGMFDITIQDMDDEDEDKAKNVLKKHPDYLIHNQDFATEVKNPTRIDPQPFYDYFYVNIAAALVMPKQMLIGGDIGNVTGSEVGTSAYYSDVQNNQLLVFTNIIENIYKELLTTHGKKWDYVIEWNPIYVDELSEAKILQTRSYSATQSVSNGIVSIPEARKMLNDGIVDLDPNKIPKPPVEDKPPVSDPNIEPQPVIKPQSNSISLLTKYQKKMIKNLKEKGKIELEEQEKRLKEAKKVSGLKGKK